MEGLISLTISGSAEADSCTKSPSNCGDYDFYIGEMTTDSHSDHFILRILNDHQP